MNGTGVFSRFFSPFMISIMFIGSAYSKELTSLDLQKWFDPFNRSAISGFHDFMNANISVSEMGYDDISLWDVDHEILFKDLPVKYVGATADGRRAFLTLANILETDLQPLASSLFCELDKMNLSLDWAHIETGMSHVVMECALGYGEATYDQCVEFVQSPRYVDGAHNAMAVCRDLVFDFTQYTDKDVCLGFVGRKDFVHEEKRRGLDCETWFNAYVP